MRERLTFAFVSLTLTVLTVFLIARGYAIADLIEEQQRAELGRSAQTLSVMLAETGTVPPALLDRVVRPGESLEYVDAQGNRTRVGSVEEPHADDLGATVRLPEGGTLTLTRSAQVVDDLVATELLPLVLIGLGLAVVGTLIGVVAARRLARPFHELAEVAGDIGRGHFDATVPRYDVPEADAVARVLRSTTHDLDNLVRRERHFAANASHELRTPITALRLELEDLALSPRTPPEVVEGLSGALEQLDRLSATVAELLDTSRASRFDSMVDIDLALLLHDTVAQWRAVASSRMFVDDFSAVLPVRLPAGSLVQVMDVLIGNAITHGVGTVRVEVEQRADYVEVLVGDDGPRAAAAEGAGHPVASGGGGLAAATRIVHALGGQLRLTEAPRTTYSLVLPRARGEGPSPTGVPESRVS